MPAKWYNCVLYDETDDINIAELTGTCPENGGILSNPYCESCT